jgi:hypothetical protein
MAGVFVSLAFMLGLALIGSTSPLEERKAFGADTIYVKAYSMDKSEQYSMFTTISHNGAIIKSGFTPLTFAGEVGKTYSVSVSDYNADSLFFNKWGSGSTTRERTFTMGTDNLWFDALFSNTKVSDGTSTGLTSTTTSTTTPTPTTSTTATTSPPIAATPIEKLIPKTGVYVALYMYPSNTGSVSWQKVIDEKTKHPSVPFVVTFNPSSGPGSAKDTNIANWVAKLKDAGIVTLGYTFDNYGTRSDSALTSDADKYRNWYNADGLFIDEFANYAGSENHYQEVTNYAKSIGMKMTMGNPGADVPQSYLGTVDVINIVEGKGYVPISRLQYCFNCSPEQGWQYKVDKRNFAYMGYDIGSLDTAFVSESSKWVGLVYLTDGNDSNARWLNLPSYFSQEVALLDK